MGITPQMIDQTLYDAFGQRQVSTLYTQLNQYHVVLEMLPQFQSSPSNLHDIYVRSALAADLFWRRGWCKFQRRRYRIALPRAQSAAYPARILARTTRVGESSRVSARRTAPPFRSARFAHFESATAPLTINHQGQFPVVTISFNLAPGASLGDATTAIEQAQQVRFTCRSAFSAAFQGTAASFQASLANEPLLILAAVITVYIVLGVLYESYVHPITILSTLPSAGVGAILALMICGSGIQRRRAHWHHPADRHRRRKTRIMMIDFALEAERKEGKNSDRRHLSGVPAPLPSHHDDHHGRAARRLCLSLWVPASARNCASRSALPLSAVFWSARS